MSRLVNVANINYVEYIEHEKHPWIEYRPAKKILWVLPFEEYWTIPWMHECYSEEEVYKKFPEYTIDINNRVVRKDPILYIHMTNGNKLTVKDNAKQVYGYISKLNGKGIISI